MLNKIKDIKRCIRRTYLYFRFKLSSTPVYTNVKDRDLGLTTMLMHESLENKIPILVTSQIATKRLAHEMFRLGQLGMSQSYTEQYIENNLILVSNRNYRGKKYQKLLIDNMCSEDDVIKFIENNYPMELRGFITKRCS